MFSLHGHLIRPVASRLPPEHLQLLRSRGGRPAGSETGTPALRKVDGTIVIPVGEAIEIDRVSTETAASASVGATMSSVRLNQPHRHAAPRRTPDACHHRQCRDQHLACLSHATNSAACRVPEHPPPRCHQRRDQPDLFEPSDAFTNPAVFSSQVNASDSAPATAANAAPSSSKTPTCGACTAKKKSPSAPAKAPSPSPASTSPARGQPPPAVKRQMMTLGQASPEPPERHAAAQTGTVRGRFHGGLCSAREGGRVQASLDAVDIGQPTKDSGRAALHPVRRCRRPSQTFLPTSAPRLTVSSGSFGAEGPSL